MLEPNNIYLGDCLEVMKEIPDKSIDLILCDLPYGTTACKWDSVIPFEPLWDHYKRIIKDNRAIVLFGSQPFTSALIMSNIKMFKYCLVWEKNRYGGFFDVNFRPLKAHEDICVFSLGGTSNGSKIPVLYNPQEVINIKPKSRSNKGLSSTVKSVVEAKGMQTKSNYPKSVIKINNEFKTFHSTQKPVALLEYLIKTYSNEGDTILDNCIGSGSTAIAALNTNRKFIGIEKDFEYHKLAVNRVLKRQLELTIDVSS